MSEKYFKRIEVSNSDLTWLKNHLNPKEQEIDPTEYYNFGTLLDALITEPEKVDFLNLEVNGIDFRKKDFGLAEKMKRSFLEVKECRDLLSNISTFQEVNTKVLNINYRGIKTSINGRCKHDIKVQNYFGCDIKTTVAINQTQFENVCEYFDYDRQMAWYMDISGLEKYMIVGISKKNFKVFKVYITKDSKFYKRGKLKYSELANWWVQLFGADKQMFCE